ncbi:MAG TPA: DUF2232 domain-containing protein [Spirochaetia bacterium]|nr:DUF2232 domain-containing protein [Spirochaetia bacterium]
MNHERSPWTETAVLSVAAILLYHVGLLQLFFLVPMQILYLRRGEGAYKYGALLFLGGVLAVKAVTLFTAQFVGVEPLVVSLDFLVPLALLGALYTMNVTRVGQRGGIGQGRAISVASRALAASIFGGLLSLPLVIYMVGTGSLVHLLRSQIQLWQEMLQQSAAQSGAAVEPGISPDQMAKVAIDIFLRFYLFGFFLMVYLDWYLGTQIGRRMTVAAATRESGQGIRTVIGPDAGIRIPAYMLWLLLVSWGGVLASVFVGIGPFEYVVWNLAMIVGFLYAMQGFAIIQYLFRIKNVARGARYLLLTGMIALLFVPTANLLVLVSFPVLGVSETWIHYRKLERSEK